mmetsp:Transcript_19720/g.45386  ORF Transcript_19720/g.45386 Transcript_19720/m.45386 type:complete len:293 (-) Transcript_19720:813-1691(-)
MEVLITIQVTSQRNSNMWLAELVERREEDPLRRPWLNTKLVSNLPQGPRDAVGEPKAQHEHEALVGVEVLAHQTAQVAPQHREHHLLLARRALVFDRVRQREILLLAAELRVQRLGARAHLLDDVPHLLRVERALVEHRSHLLVRRRLRGARGELGARALDAAVRMVDAQWQPNRSALLLHRLADGIAHPKRGVRREADAHRDVELGSRVDESDAALLHQICLCRSLVDGTAARSLELLNRGANETHVRLDNGRHCPSSLNHHSAQLACAQVGRLCPLLQRLLWDAREREGR